MKKKTSALLIFLVIVGCVVGIVFMLRNRTTPTQAQSPIPKEADGRVKVAEAKAIALINKPYTFGIRDQKGKEVASFTYTLDTAELRNEIVVKGKKASAVSGKTFFIVNLKLTNSTEKTITIDTRTYVRLSVNGNDKELMAPEIYNDPVQIQPISTKVTRVGFPLNDTDKNLKLHVGEVAKEKETIEIKFQ